MNFWICNHQVRVVHMSRVHSHRNHWKFEYMCSCVNSEYYSRFHIDFLLKYTICNYFDWNILGRYMVNNKPQINNTDIRMTFFWKKMFIQHDIDVPSKPHSITSPFLKLWVKSEDSIWIRQKGTLMMTDRLI